MSLSFPLIPSLTDELRRRVPVSAVRTFPYIVDELLRRVPVSAVRLFLIQLRSYSAVFLFLPYVHFLIQRACTHTNTYTYTQVDNLGNNRGDTRGANLGRSVDSLR